MNTVTLPNRSMLDVEAPLIPEKVFIGRMICLAVLDMFRKPNKSKLDNTAREDARDWLFNDDSLAVLTFTECCHYLNTEPDYLRKALYKVDKNGITVEEVEKLVARTMGIRWTSCPKPKRGKYKSRNDGRCLRGVNDG